MAKGKWTIKKLLRTIKAQPSGFFYNPLSWGQENLNKCVKEAKKKGIVTTRYWSPRQREVVLLPESYDKYNLKE